jgi:hypothetical protein
MGFVLLFGPDLTVTSMVRLWAHLPLSLELAFFSCLRQSISSAPLAHGHLVSLLFMALT